MTSISRFRLLQYVALLVIFALFYGSVRTTVADIMHAIDNRVSNSTRLEEASKFYLEYQDLILELENLAHGHEGASQQRVQLAFDLLWARVETLSRDEAYKVVQDLDTEKRLFSEVKSALLASEDMVALIGPNDLQAAAAIQELFKSAAPLIRAFADAAYVQRLKTYVDAAQTQRNATERLSMIHVAFLAIGLLTPLLLAGEVYRVRRLNNEIIRREAQIISLGMTDMLTGLGNRRALVAALQAKAGIRDSDLSLVLLDLDEFKPVNDTFGHQTGDQLLAQAAMRLKAVCDRSNGSAYRLGGDEFAILSSAPGGAVEFACALIQEMEKSFFIGGREINISASAGIVTTRPGETLDAHRLIGNADVALYEAKRTGRGRAIVFEAELRDVVNFRNVIASDLPKAIDAGEIDVWYQPQFATNEQKIVGVEALARWHHPKLGSISPDVFVREAERQGIVRSLDLAVLKKACADIRQLNLDGADLRLSVNVSPMEAGRPGYCNDVMEVIGAARFPKNRLTIELTENILMDDYDAVAANLEQLTRFGLRTAIDDFGAGYSNLGYLARFSFSYLKVDKSVAQKLNNNPRYKLVLAGVTQLAADMGLKVVLEGVEDAQQYDAARKMGIAIIQGFYVSRALQFDALASFVKKGWLPPEQAESRTAA